METETEHSEATITKFNALLAAFVLREGKA